MLPQVGDLFASMFTLKYRSNSLPITVAKDTSQLRRNVDRSKMHECLRCSTFCPKRKKNAVVV